MRITNIESFHLRGAVEALPDSSMESLLIRISTDAGYVGWGESDGARGVNQAAINAPYSSPVLQGLKQLLLGEDPFDITRLWKKMYDGTLYCGRDGAFIHAMAGIDLALWDLKGPNFPASWFATPSKWSPVLRRCRRSQALASSPILR